MQMRRTTGIILLLFVFLSTVRADEPDKYIPKTKRKQEKLATSEPGSYLKPSANYALKKINRFLDDSTLKKPAPWIVGLFTPPQKKVTDTILSFNDLEVSVRVYYPSGKSMNRVHPLTIFYHGGGFVLGSVEDYHSMASKLARVTGQIIVSVDYRLAPEHPYPAAVKDCYAVLQWIQHYGSKLGADTTRITVMGDSAGGNLATVMTLKCHDQKRPQPYRQVLLYPAVTLMDKEYPSMIHYMQNTDRRYVLSETFCMRVRREYIGNVGNDRDRYISPLETELSDDLAPALIIAAECDPLRDSERAYAKKLKAAGVQVNYMEYSGMIHAFMSFPMLINDARDAMKEVRDYLCEN
jgi:acetyl esterase